MQDKKLRARTKRHTRCTAAVAVQNSLHARARARSTKARASSSVSVRTCSAHASLNFSGPPAARTTVSSGALSLLRKPGMVIFSRIPRSVAACASATRCAGTVITAVRSLSRRWKSTCARAGWQIARLVSCASYWCAEARFSSSRALGRL
jgi:hypothetical protein